MNKKKCYSLQIDAELLAKARQVARSEYYSCLSSLITRYLIELTEELQTGDYEQDVE